MLRIIYYYLLLLLRQNKYSLIIIIIGLRDVTLSFIATLNARKTCEAELEKDK